MSAFTDQNIDSLEALLNLKRKHIEETLEDMASVLKPPRAREQFTEKVYQMKGESLFSAVFCDN